MKISTVFVVCFLIIAVGFLVKNTAPNGVGGPPEAAAAVSTPAVRQVISTSCSSDGCPTTCEPTEALVSAFCVSHSNSARPAESLLADNGVLTAKCGSNSTSLVMYCVRK